MPPKKAKTTLTKKRPSHGKATKHKPSKANKTRTKATKRKSQAKKRQDKYRQTQRKERKRADRAKRTAKKTATKKTKTKMKDKNKKSKDKKKKQAAKKKPTDPGKQQPQSDEEESGEGDGGKVEMKFTGMTVNQMQNLRQQVTALTKNEFLDQIKNSTEHHSEAIKFQSAYLGSPENRMKLFYDSEKPTDGSAGPFQSNRFGAIFLLPG